MEGLFEVRFKVVVKLLDIKGVRKRRWNGREVGIAQFISFLKESSSDRFKKMGKG